jgi:uncharacterized membrane protein
MGIPIGLLGLGANLILLLMLFLEDRIAFLQTYGATLMFGIVLFGVMYSVYLVYLQAAVIEAFCPWCLAHEALYVLLLITSGLRLRQSLTDA